MVIADALVGPVTEEIEVDESTAIQVYQWLREVCSYRLCHIDPSIKFGGTGKIVAIDESTHNKGEIYMYNNRNLFTSNYRSSQNLIS